jgi:CRISPR-associated protein Cas2
MVVIILESVPRRLRGELSRWLIEPHANIFVGHISAMVRDKLWEKCCKSVQAGGVLMIWTTNNEQHFMMNAYGDTKRTIVDYEGLQLIQIPDYQSILESSRETDQEA